MKSKRRCLKSIHFGQSPCQITGSWVALSASQLTLMTMFGLLTELARWKIPKNTPQRILRLRNAVSRLPRCWNSTRRAIFSDRGEDLAKATIGPTHFTESRSTIRAMFGLVAKGEDAQPTVTRSLLLPTKELVPELPHTMTTVF